VPQRTAPNGVADYARSLAHTLGAFNGIDTVYLSATGSDTKGLIEDDLNTVWVRSHKPDCLACMIASLCAESKARAVLLHFSGYGYQKRGAPLWLLKGLRIWRHRTRTVRLLTVFHELYASGRMWQSSFWLSPVQKGIARHILNLSAGAITPTAIYENRLRHWRRGDVEIKCMPVFSNVGEAEDAIPPSARAAIAVVFGLAGIEDRLFGDYRPRLERIVAAVGIKRVIDIGPRFSPVPSSIGGAPVISMGTLSPVRVSEVLQKVKFGFVAYPLHVIGKSGVFAAYAAHGVVPIVFSDKPGQCDGLQQGRHLLDGLKLERGIGNHLLASIQSELRVWYASHSLRVQADVVEKMIMS